MGMWPAERARELERKILALASRPTFRFTFHHTIGEKMPYFPEQLEAELASLGGDEAFVEKLSGEELEELLTE